MVVRKSSLAALGLFVAGLVLIVASVPDEPGIHRLRGVGGLSWIAAWYVILAQNVVERAPVQTRGGIVAWEKSRKSYIANFVILGLAGLTALIVVVTTCFVALR